MYAIPARWSELCKEKKFSYSSNTFPEVDRHSVEGAMLKIAPEL